MKKITVFGSARELTLAAKHGFLGIKAFFYVRHHLPRTEYHHAVSKQIRHFCCPCLDTAAVEDMEIKRYRILSKEACVCT